VLNAFVLTIVGDAGGGYTGVRGHEPDVERKSRQEIHKCVNELRAIVPRDGAYVSESKLFQENWQQAYWGSNYARLALVKKKYDPTGLFFVHNGVGSEEWSEDAFVRKLGVNGRKIESNSAAKQKNGLGATASSSRTWLLLHDRWPPCHRPMIRVMPRL
jgi:hypothetical protein